MKIDENVEFYELNRLIILLSSSELPFWRKKKIKISKMKNSLKNIILNNNINFRLIDKLVYIIIKNLYRMSKSINNNIEC